MRTQNNSTPPKETTRGRILFLVWQNMPRLALLFLVIIIVALMVIISGEKKRLEKEKMTAQAQTRKPMNAVLLDLKPGTIQDALNLPGVIEPWIQLELMARINGTISEVVVQEGTVVRKGDVLALFEPDDYRISLDSARASYTLARSNYVRAKKMVRSKATPVAELETSETRMYTAKAAMEDAELKLSRCTIKSPMNGVIRRLDAKVGLLLNIGDPVAEILQIDRVKAVVGIPESDVSAIRNIAEMEITIQALDNRQLNGKKHFLASSPESTARLYRLELELDNQDGDMLPGMFFRAHVVKSIVHDTIAIPLYSVISRNDEQFVFIARDGVVHKRKVKLGIIEGWQVQVTEGLQPGDRIVVEGHRDVEDGQEINVIRVMTDPSGLVSP